MKVSNFKKFTAMILAALMLIAMCACSKDTNSKDTNNDVSSVENTPFADESFDLQDGNPPVNDELKEIYKKAVKLESDIMFGNVGIETNEDGSFVYKNDGDKTWYKTNDERFATYAELEEYVKSIFTDELAESKLKEYGIFKDIDGALYTTGGARGANIAYAGHYFTIEKVEEDSVQLTAHVYSESDAAINPPFYAKPDDESKYSVENVEFEYVKIDGAWKLSKFALLY